ncbi:MAG: SCP2 sterol-binding domain-containing protein [Chloroflexia bacterium]|nr:SCP2 sterol-binding domain-containing protein [Chloroflexia bacterium]
MRIRFPSDAWIKELSRLLNESESYERSAKDWEGDFLFVIQEDDALADTAYLYMDLYHGKSPSAAELSGPEEKQAAYVLEAPFGTWRRVIEGKLDPIQGMMTRQLELSGNMMQIMRYPKAAKEIVSCCAVVPTDFGDG